jgi:hypothetical protein
MNCLIAARRAPTIALHSDGLDRNDGLVAKARQLAMRIQFD